MEDRMRVTSLMLASVPPGTRLVFLGGRSQQSGRQVEGLGGQTEPGVGDMPSFRLGDSGHRRSESASREGTRAAALRASVVSTELTNVIHATCVGPTHRRG